MPPASTSRDFLEMDVIARLSRLTLRPRGLVEGNFSGMHKSPHRGASVEFAEYRKYVKGDDIRHIDWRAYARSDRYYLKEFEADTHLRCHLLLDSSGSMGYSSHAMTKWEYAVRLGATLAYLVIHQGDHVGVQCLAGKLVHDIPPRGKPSHLRHIYDTLAETHPQGETHLIDALHDLAEKIRKRALVVLVSDLLTDVGELLTCFQHLRHRKHDVAVFHLLDPQELHFQFDRPVRFVDLEGGESLLTEPTVIQGQYDATLQEYLQHLATGCGQFGIDYHLVDTSRPYEQVLSDFLLARLRR